MKNKKNTKSPEDVRFLFFYTTIIVSFILAVPYFANAKVLLHDSWEYTYIKSAFSSSANYDMSGMYISGHPDYCVNPNSDGCDDAHLDCSQNIGPVIPTSNIPDASCRHSLNIGGAPDGFPKAVDGDNVFRAYIDVNDATVKGHWGGRAELTSRSSGITSTRKKTKWFGCALYVPFLPHENFTYDASGLFQWHGGSTVSLYMYLNGGVLNEWNKDVGLRVVSQNDNSSHQKMVPSVSGERIGDSNFQFVLKNTGKNGGGNINDLGDWMYFVWVYNADPDGAHNGRFTLWYASQKMIDTCNDEGVGCYIKAFDTGHNFDSGYSHDNEIYMKFGADESGTPARDSNYYPVIFYRDNFRIADGSHSSDSANFNEVDPAVYVEVPTIIRADVNQDSQINATDAMLTLRKSLDISMNGTNWETSDTTGDVNCDNKTNTTDAMLILRYSLGLSMSGTGWCDVG